MRALESPPCPSATKISPFGAVSTSDGRLKVSGPSPGTPARPSVKRTFPSALNFTTWWPLPSFPSASVTHTLPALSMWMPWGNANIPAPKLLRNLPDGLSLTSGAAFEPMQEFAPHRSNTQMLLLRSISIALVCPHFLPSGSFPQPSSRYGFCWA